MDHSHDAAEREPVSSVAFDGKPQRFAHGASSRIRRSGPQNDNRTRSQTGGSDSRFAADQSLVNCDSPGVDFAEIRSPRGIWAKSPVSNYIGSRRREQCFIQHYGGERDPIPNINGRNGAPQTHVRNRTSSIARIESPHSRSGTQEPRWVATAGARPCSRTDPRYATAAARRSLQ